MAQKLWSGRFRENTDQRVEAFTESISFDHRLFKQDIQTSIAHARMLASIGLLTADECQQIVRALSDIQAEFEDNRFPFMLEREDVHMHVEAALVERLGDTGRKLHTGRSRNDQVATDLRLWARSALDRVDNRLLDLLRGLLNAAVQNRDVILPGYTHLQPAQPILAAHYFLAYAEKFERDRSRLADCRSRLNVCPLGAAALAGTTLPLDRFLVARELDFEEVAANSLDATSDRDFVLESVFVVTLIAEHLSSLAEDWIIWNTQEFGFLSLPEAFCTGSSIMPQKKNPDVLELIRGRTAQVVGDLVTLLMLVKGLPSAYNRDLQGDKKPLFDAFDTIEVCLELATVLVEGARLRKDRIAQRLDEGFLDATALMEYLIKQGVPQRTAHEAVGRLVSLCERRGLPKLADLADADLTQAHPKLGTEARSVLGVENAVRAFRSYGSTAPAEVDRQLQIWQRKLACAQSPPDITSNQP
jgi:argininosuccinate lyase